MKRKSIIQTLTRADFRKVVNYYLNGRGKVTRISHFSAKTVIFHVITYHDNMLFSIDTNFRFMDAVIKNSQIHSTFTFDVSNLKYLVNTIDFFNRDEKSRLKMGFPVITLKR